MLSAEPKEVLTALQGESVRWTERTHVDCAGLSGVTLKVRAIECNQTEASMH